MSCLGDERGQQAVFQAVLICAPLPGYSRARISTVGQHLWTGDNSASLLARSWDYLHRSHNKSVDLYRFGLASAAESAHRGGSLVIRPVVLKLCCAASSLRYLLKNADSGGPARLTRKG